MSLQGVRKQVAIAVFVILSPIVAIAAEVDYAVPNTFDIKAFVASANSAGIVLMSSKPGDPVNGFFVLDGGTLRVMANLSSAQWASVTDIVIAAGGAIQN